MSSSQPESIVRYCTFPDGTALVRVTGCPYCKRWTRTSATVPGRYPYHQSWCDWRREEMPLRIAYINPKEPAEDPIILQILPEGTAWEDWEPK